MKTHRWTILAMAVPILLMAGFQTYWIRQSYKEETRLLKKESSMIFRDVFFEALMGFKPEGNFPPPSHFHGHDRHGHSEEPKDSLKKEGPEHERKDDHGFWPKEEPYELGRMLPDSLNLLLEKRMKENNLVVESAVQIVHEHDTTPMPAGVFRTLFLPYHHESEQMICAEITGYGPLLFRRIIPHIGVSLVLVGIVFAALLFLFRHLRRSEKAAMRQRQFISNVTHELKTPISTVHVALEALKSFHAIDDAVKTREYLDISSRELNRLNQMADRILQMSQLESGQLKLQTGPCNLQEIATSVTESLRIQAEQREGHIHIETSGTDFSLTGDKVHLGNILYNLVDNALKYSPGKPEITLSLRSDAQHVIAEVRDKGEGIPKEELSRIFDKFYRVQQGDRHNVKGYGLGLSYVQEMVKLHGGTISVKSTPGKGSIFTVSFPKSHKRED